MHVRRPPANGQPGISRQCAANNPLTERQPGIKSYDYKWDMNGSRWSGRAKLLSGAQIDALNSGGFALELWEDDIWACELSASQANWQTVTAFLSGVFLALSGIIIDESSPNGCGECLGLAFSGLGLAFGALAALVTSGDDFVGGVVVPQGQFGATSNTNMIIVRGSGLIGRAFIKVYDATPPAPGPTAAVRISNESGYLVPVGGMSWYNAWAVDANGRAAPDRPVSWSSSNPTIASVDGYGWVSGYAEGTATITATVDGVSNSVSVSIVPYGPASSVQVIPNSLALRGGQRQTLSVRIFDANGFELPVSAGVVTWEVGDPNVCTVDTDNVVTAHGSPYWTTLAAVVEGDQETVRSEPVPCSVDGGGAFSRTAGEKPGQTHPGKGPGRGPHPR